MILCLDSKTKDLTVVVGAAFERSHGIRSPAASVPAPRAPSYPVGTKLARRCAVGTGARRGAPQQRVTGAVRVALPVILMVAAWSEHGEKMGQSGAGIDDRVERSLRTSSDGLGAGHPRNRGAVDRGGGTATIG